jgi:hypothetical protein
MKINACNKDQRVPVTVSATGVIQNKLLSIVQLLLPEVFSYTAIRNSVAVYTTYEAVSESARTGHLERELQMVQLSVTRCSCIAIL